MKCKPVGQIVSTFTNGFDTYAGSHSFSIAAFLAPALLRRQRLSPIDQKLHGQPKRSQRRKYSEIAAAISLDDSEASNSLPQKHKSAPKVPAAPSRKPRKPPPVLLSLDPYLPLELRSKSWLENLTDFHGIRSPETLPSVLRKGRKELKLGLLTFLGVDQERWSALFSLTKSLLSLEDKTRPSDVISQLYGHSPWLRFMPDATLDEMTALKPIAHFDKQSASAAKAGFTHTLALHKSVIASESPKTESIHSAIGELWESLGHILLYSVVMSPGQKGKAMLYIQSTIALMHSENLISAAMYEYDLEGVPVDRRKPPYLHAMRSRLMATLTDAMSKAEETNFGDDLAVMQGYESSGIVTTPQVRPLGPELWLEYILWACVHGGHYEQAIRLLVRGASRLPAKHPQWGMASWDEIQNLAIQRASDNQEAHKARSWLSKLYGPLHESINDSLTEMPPYTISSEVVLRILEAAISNKGRNNFKPDDGFLDALIRLIRRPESQSGEDQEQAAHLPAKSFLVGVQGDEFSFPRYAIKTLMAETSQNLEKVETGLISATRALRNAHMTMRVIKAVDTGDFYKSLQELGRLREFVDGQKQQLIEHYNPDLALLEYEEDAIPEEARIEIPDSTLAALLMMASDHNLLEFARWLLYSNDPDGPLIPKEATRMTVYQPSLLHYASKAKDYSLFIEITEELAKDFSKTRSATLRALTICQVHLNELESARELFSYMYTELELMPGPREIFAVACQYLTMTASGQNEGNQNSQKALALLEDILRRRFNPQDHSRQRGNTTALRRLNLIANVLSTLGGSIGEIATKCVAQPGRERRMSRPFRNEDFHPLLRTVLEVYGIQEAKKFLERWSNIGCEPTTTQREGRHKAIERPPKSPIAIQASVETVRIILEESIKDLPAVSSRETTDSVADGRRGFSAPQNSVASATPPHEETMRWAINAFRRMKIQDEPIRRLLEPYRGLFKDLDSYF